jgi:hypothetical protein
VGLVLLQLHTAVQQLKELFAACKAITKHVSMRLQQAASGAGLCAGENRQDGHMGGICSGSSSEAKGAGFAADVELGQVGSKAEKDADAGGDGGDSYVEAALQQCCTDRNSAWQQPDVSLMRCLSNDFFGDTVGLVPLAPPATLVLQPSLVR